MFSHFSKAYGFQSKLEIFKTLIKDEDATDIFHLTFRFNDKTIERGGSRHQISVQFQQILSFKSI